MRRCCESFLDWSVSLSAYGIAAGTRVDDAIQTIIGRSAGVNVPYRAGAQGGATKPSNQAFPIGTVSDQTTDNITVSSGTTLRAALQQLQAVSPVPQAVTMDYTYGLRFDPSGLFAIDPEDYGQPAVTDEPGSPLMTENLAHTMVTATFRSVMVVGTGVNVTMADGSGAPGPMGRLDDSTINTDGAARAAGYAFLAKSTSDPRGTFSVSDQSTTSVLGWWDVHPGSFVTLTDAGPA